jgi:predicted nucleic acid-binding protein
LTLYADSSFIVSLYVTDVHSPNARRVMQGASPLILTPFHRAEWAHALAQHQFRGTLSANLARDLNAQFISDEAAGVFHASSVPERAFDLCAELARRYGASLAMRTLDSLHVACALELKAEQFWTYDERQGKLARAQGLKVG